MKPIAFFSAEYGIEEKLPLYAGGLGILSGDVVREAGDQHLPFFAIGLFYRGGFEVAHLEQTTQDIHILAEHGFQQALGADGKPIIITIDTSINDKIHVQAWTRSYGTARLYLLDTNVEQNSPQYQAITNHLYDSNANNEMLQEFVLGVGGVKLLQALGVDPGVYHLNEGHTSFVALALAVQYLQKNIQETSITFAVDAVKPKIVATKHTILSGAGLYIEREAFRNLIGPYITSHRINFDELFAMGNHVDQPDLFSTTKFLLRAAIRVNGVSMLHTIFERQKHPNSTLIPITNGVYAPRWRSNNWPKDGIATLTDPEIWSIRTKLRTELVEYIHSLSKVKLNPHALTIVWARRFAAYKRPHVLFNDLERLEKIISNSKAPVQFIISGMAHKADEIGKNIIEKIKTYVEDPRFKGKIVYLPTYNIGVAQRLVAGADIWLNTPERGIEACGTSGMKAGLNGSLECTTSDGWIEEVDWTDMGWVLPNEGIETAVYNTIEHEIQKYFYDRNAEGVPEQWVKRVRKTINIVNHRFTTKTMLTNYITKMYYPEV